MSKLSEFAAMVKELMAVHPKGRRFDKDGRFYPDPTPLAPPIGYVKHPSLAEQIRSMVRSEKLRQEAEAAGLETFEEADDFDVGDDYDPRSPFEEHFYGEFEQVPDEVPTVAAPSAAASVEGAAGGGGGSPQPPPTPPVAPAVKP